MNKPKTIGEVLDLLKDQLRQNNQLDLKATEFQLIASPEGTTLGDGNPVLFMTGRDPAQMMDLTMAAVTEAFKNRYGEEDMLKGLHKMFNSMAKAFLFVGENSLEEHCGHEINRIAAEAFKAHSEHSHRTNSSNFQSEEVDDFDRLLQQTLDSLSIDNDTASRNTLNSLYGSLGIIFDATRTKQ